MALLQVALITYFTAANCFTEPVTSRFASNHKFFSLFRTCTIFFSRKPNHLTDLHLSWLNFCTTNPNRKCIQLHSTPLSIKLNVSKANSQELTQPIEQKLLAAKSFSLKFQANCIVHLPSIQIGKELRFVKANYVYKFHSYGKNDYQPDFIVLPTFMEFQQDLPEVQNSPYILSKIFILSNATPEILTVCLQCLRSVVFGSPYLPVVKLDQQTFRRRENLMNVWHEINFPLKFTEPNSKNKYCPYHKGNLKFLGNKYTGVEKVHSLSHCVMAIVLEKLNGSFASDSLKKHYHKTKMTSLLKNARIISYDIENLAFDFGFFIEKPQSRMENISWVGLLSPFSLIDWIVITVYLVGLATVLSLLNFQGNPYFWIFSTLLEQGDDGQSSRKPGNALLLLLWLIVLALHLRNLYTCSLYTYMTKDSGPMNIPRNVEKLLDVKNVLLLSTSTYSDYINDLREAWRRHKAIEIQSSKHIWLNILQKRVVINSPVALVNSLLTSSNNAIRCSPYSLTSQGKGGKQEDHICLNKKLFGIFLPNEELNANAARLAINSVLIYMTNKFYYVEKRETNALPQMFIWGSTQDSYIYGRVGTQIARLTEFALIKFQQGFLNLKVLQLELARNIARADSKLLTNASADLAEFLGKGRRAVLKWIKLGCFKHFKESCTLNDIKQDGVNIDDPDGVSLIDLKSLLILYGVLIMLNTCIFWVEISVCRR